MHNHQFLVLKRKASSFLARTSTTRSLQRDWCLLKPNDTCHVVTTQTCRRAITTLNTAWLHRAQTYTVSQKKVAHHTLLNIFVQGWPIAKISTATESEIISEHICVINVLIFNVPKCCHLANNHASNWQRCVHKNCTYFEGIWSDRLFARLLLAC